jgi:hypothetical protein
MYQKFKITIILPVFNLQSSNFGFLERIKWLSSTLLEVLGLKLHSDFFF